MAKAKTKKPTVDEIIAKAVNAARLVDERKPKNAFKATEKRLYAYPVIGESIENDRSRIDEVSMAAGAPTNIGGSILRFQKSGVRLSPGEIADALMNDLTVKIAEKEYERDTIEKALKIIEGDEYESIVKFKYFEGKNLDEIAALMSCDKTTAWRNNSRLVGKIAIFLYGVDAI